MKSILTFLLFIVLHCPAQTTESFNVNGVPEVYINLLEPGPITRDSSLSAHMQILNASGSNYAPDQLYNGFIDIKGRGHSSWNQPKKPYSIDLVDSTDNDFNAALLGMPAETDWTLIANYDDKSLLRNSLAYYLGNAIGMDYSPRYRFVEVYLDSNYLGLYILCEKIKKSDYRVNIKKLTDDPKDQVDPNVTGGYIIEITPARRIETTDSFFTTALKSKNYVFDYPKSKNITTQQVSYMTQYVNDFEAALFGPDFTDTSIGYAKYIDVNSFVDWYLINELAKNNDAHLYASCYFHKDRDGKLKAGPLWDFDIGFGNINYNGNDKEDGYWVETSFYFNRLFQDSSFIKKVQARWSQIRPIIESIPSLLSLASNQLVQSGAINRNFQQWPILGTYVWPNSSPYPNKYSGEILRLTDWIKQRTNWLNINLQYTAEAQCDSIKNTKPVISIIGTDNFDRYKPFAVHTLAGFAKYYWNNTETTSFDTTIKTTGKYWLKAVSATGCETHTSDTLYFDSIPVLKLISFTAEKVDTKANLSWQTTSETDSDYYIIQRSTKGKDFFDLKQITSTATTTDTSNYIFTDEEPKYGLNVYRLKIFDGGKITYSEDDTLNFDTIPVLKLIKFTVVKKDKDAEIKWNVTSETDSDYFVVQRENDGENFTDLKKILSNGNTPGNQSYSFEDAYSENHLDLYRLKLSDDGKITYSEIDTLDFRSTSIILYPNPAENILKIEFNVAAPQDVLLQITDSKGALVVTRKLINIPAGEYTEPVSVSRLAPGIYYVHIKTDQKILNSSFLKN